MPDLRLVPSPEDRLITTGAELRRELLNAIDLMRATARTLDASASTARACSLSDPAVFNQCRDVALDAIATGTGAIRRQLDGFRAVFEKLGVVEVPREAADTPSGFSSGGPDAA